MNVVFKKRRDHSGIMTITRDDGSTTWQKLKPEMVYHDLAHVVVEKQLRLKSSFFSMINQGYTIEEFEEPKPARPEALIPKNLPAESIQTEHFINLLMSGVYNGTNHKEFLSMLNSILSQHELPPFQAMSTAELETIWSALRKRFDEWKQLPVEKSLAFALNHFN